MADLDFRTLLSELSLEEKLKLLSGLGDFHSTGGVPRLNIPPLKTVDSINGIRPTDFHGELTTACFPNTTCLASTWNVDLLEKMGQQIAHQARTKHAQVVLGPTINIHRDPRAGRNFECFSEDPLLSGHLGAAIVNGIQSSGVGACPKHFVCNDSETLRHFYNVAESPDSRTLREIYLAAWEILLQRSTPVAIMAAYNKVDGTYCSENSVLLDKVLRQEWGFDGIVMSDWFGTRSTVPAIKAGLDLEMPFPVFRGEKLLAAIQNGEVEEKIIDSSAEKMLELRNKTRLSHGQGLETSEITEENNLIARELAHEGIILLKNTNEKLPLDISKFPKIAMIGEYAKRPIFTGGGSASCKPQYRQCPYELLQEVHPEPEHVAYAPGVRTRVVVPVAPNDCLTARNGQHGVDVRYFNDDSSEQILEEFSDSATVFMLGDYKKGLNIHGSHLEMSTTLVPKTSGNHLLAVRHSGACSLKVDNIEVLQGAEPDITTEQFLFSLTKYESRIEIAMEAGKSYHIDLMMRSRRPMVGEPTPCSATLCFEEEYSEMGVIGEAAEIASRSDVSLVYVGRNEQHESEGFDLETIKLPQNQSELIHAVAEVSKKTVVLLHCGNPIDVESFVDKVDAVINMHFPGQEGPQGVIDILIGKVNPSGRLPTTWFNNLEDWPSFHNFPAKKLGDGDPEIRYEEGLSIGYRASDQNSRVRWPFGYGLSYTSYNYRDLKVSLNRSSSSTTISASVTVENVGQVSGKEVVQVFISSKSTSKVWRPQRELKSFTKILLHPGKSQVVSFEMDVGTALSYWDETKKSWHVESGDYRVEVGGISSTFFI